MGENLKEFEKYWKKYNKHIHEELQYYARETLKDGWKAALEMIYYKGVLESSLAGDLIEEELPDGSI